MAQFQVLVMELQDAARELEKTLAEFNDASLDAIDAGKKMANEWEGDAREAFVTEQLKAETWYKQMVEITRTYISALKAAADAYEAADAAAKSAIGG